ncbi:MAG: secondary thiamine-phosphate synthase enzyme YjbQ [Acidobacteria bacterium]|nr:secondary thiamine-phosphate synthase enzyme YjbQ [Acidobacteriota bacterium]MDW7983482.1 secondary thiamine-phosphate synthase enzyme YjbQ [Acidobacteriota bacterium]
MRIYGFQLSFRMDAETSADITTPVQDQVRASGIHEGFVVLFAQGSTCALSTMEFEPGLRKDLFSAMERIAPSDIDYAHHRTWNDGNGRSHVRATVVGPSLTIPITKGRLDLGTWQQIVLFNFDIHARERVVIGKVFGEP